MVSINVIVVVVVAASLHVPSSSAVKAGCARYIPYCKYFEKYLSYTALRRIYDMCECANLGEHTTTTTSTTTTTTTTTPPKETTATTRKTSPTKPTTTTTVPITSSTPDPDLFSEPNCGKSPLIENANDYLALSARIAGGHDAEDCEFPWMVTIWYPVNENMGKFCGGCLIDNRHVLTAAHCIPENLTDPTIIQIKLGSSNRQKMKLRLNAERVFVHPDYELIPSQKNPHWVHAVHHDAAVIRLDSAVKYTSCIQPVCLATREVQIPKDTLCLASGWGIMKVNGTVSDHLQEVKLPIYNKTECSRRYNEIDEYVICAGYPEGKKAACKGDSGGPLTCVIGNQWVMVGCTSFSKQCGAPNAPNVYTNLPKYYEWIDNVRKS